MKFSSIIFSAIITISFLGSLSAQNFFPLKIGNKNQYKIDWAGHGPGGSRSGTFYGKSGVSKDSIINGKKFYRVDFNKTTFLEPPYHLYDTFFSYDTVEQKLYVKFYNDDSTRTAADFNVLADSSFTSYLSGYPRNYISQGISTDTLYGIPVQVFQMTLDSTNIEIIYRFAERFGFMYNNLFQANGTTWGVNYCNLISSIIDSTFYNPLTLEIVYLSPLINRPINAFPFVMQGSYQASIPSTVDSFYVDIINTRADTLVFTRRFDLMNGNANISIYSSQLQVGDILKVKATATDETIFNNVAHYPDTNYALIHVLPSTVDVSNSDQLINTFSLKQNFPNPFNPVTNINYTIGEESQVRLEIYNLLGEKIVTLVDNEQQVGRFRIVFDSDKFSLSSGIYFYKLVADDYIQTRKMILSK